MEEIVIQDSANNIDNNFLSKYYNNGLFEITFSFKSDFKKTKIIRDYLIAIFDFLEIGMLWKNRFVLIVDELNNNAIEYGSSSESDNKLFFKAQVSGSEVIISIEVSDAGDGKASKNSKEMEELRINRLNKGFDNHSSIRGRGLFLIITKLVDNLYFKDNNKNGLTVGINKIISK
ncbi:ATP-binding protein [Candidatus Gracilibacteria bacterium]|nr:ATP-binding protein [Candidatus Gracilibacteria bacterium]